MYVAAFVAQNGRMCAILQIDDGIAVAHLLSPQHLGKVIEWFEDKLPVLIPANYEEVVDHEVDPDSQGASSSC